MANFNLKKLVVKAGILPIIEALVSTSDLPIYITNESMGDCIFQIGAGIDYNQQLMFQNNSHCGSHHNSQKETKAVLSDHLPIDLGTICHDESVTKSAANSMIELSVDPTGDNSKNSYDLQTNETAVKPVVGDGNLANQTNYNPANQKNVYLRNWQKHALIADTEIVGYVLGNAKSAAVAQFLNHWLQREVERKSLAKEVLEKYREINFLYKIGDKLANCLTVQEISNLLLDEMAKIIDTTSASVMLINEQTGYLDIICSRGTATYANLQLKPGEGIAGYVFTSGKAEIVNYLNHDSRYAAGHVMNQCLICAPLSTSEKTIGVINLSHTEPVNYTAEDLKLVTTFASQASAAMENALLHESKLKQERIKNNLGRYLSPQVVQSIIEAKDGVALQTNKQKITMLFSDIRNFTTKCEELAPEELVGYLNEYFSHMVGVIFSHQGTVNKFVGDMIVAMFGAPAALANQEYYAIKAAIDMQTCLQRISQTWIRDNFLTGIGISCGEVVVGNIGAPQHMDYTAIGDEVNVASRLQGLAKGRQILVTRSVYEATTQDFKFREFGTMQVKGKKNTVDVFEVLY
ncbi:MAG: adenylate/guanylate cyclase domain-containing protein [Pseudanabaena sp. ELA607]